MQMGPPFRPQQHHHHDSPRYRATLLHDDDVTGVAFAGDRVITASWGGAADEPVLGGGGLVGASAADVFVFVGQGGAQRPVHLDTGLDTETH